MFALCISGDVSTEHKNHKGANQEVIRSQESKGIHPILIYLHSYLVTQDIKRQAEIIDLLLKGLDQRMANPRSNMYQYKQTNIADVIRRRKGVKSSEEITHKLKAPEIPESLSGSITTTTPTTQRGFTWVDADDELYKI